MTWIDRPKRRAPGLARRPVFGSSSSSSSSSNGDVISHRARMATELPDLSLEPRQHTNEQRESMAAIVVRPARSLGSISPGQYGLPVLSETVS
jgi:hypothetical protein